MSLAALIADGTLPLVAVGLILAEVLVLLTLSRRRPGLNRLVVLANGASGAALMMALREGLRDGPPLAVAVWLSVSLVAHMADLAARWKG